MLAFVLVQPLHLDIEERVRIDDDVGSLLDQVGQNSFVISLDGLPFPLKADVAGQWLYPLELVFQIWLSIGRRCAE